MPIIKKMTIETHKKVAKNLLKLKSELMSVVRYYDHTDEMYNHLYDILSAIEDARVRFSERLMEDHLVRKKDEKARVRLDKIYFPTRPD